MSYDEIRELQNQGEECPHCKAPTGHFSLCPLLNRAVAEARSAAAGALNIPDQHFLKAFNITW